MLMNLCEQIILQKQNHNTLTTQGRERETLKISMKCERGIKREIIVSSQLPNLWARMFDVKLKDTSFHC